MMNSPVHRNSLAEEVAEQLRIKISAGKYQVGEQLPTEPELMKQFGVGRSSIREAVRILVNSGLLKVQQGVGTFIQDHAGITESLQQRLKRADAEDLDEVRQLLEMKIAKKAALHHTESQLKKIEAKLHQRNTAAQTGTLEECVQADIDFHMSIAQAAGNPILTDLYQSFAIQLKGWFLKLYPDITIFRETTVIHEELYHYIKNRDGEGAWNCVDQIIKQ